MPSVSEEQWLKQSERGGGKGEAKAAVQVVQGLVGLGEDLLQP